MKMDVLPMTAQSSDLTSEEEQGIMHRARDDLTAFAPIYEQYFAQVYSYCLRRVDNAQEAEDLSSLIFSRALRNVQGYQDGSVRAWLFTIAHNTIVNHYRDRKQKVSLDDTRIQLADESHSPDEAFLHNERAESIREIVATLPPDEQELLALKVNGGLSAEEIGKVLGKKSGTVRVTLHRIIKRLRALYLEELR